MSDLRYALRQLARSPGFTAVAVLTLALGAGANSLLFSVIYAVLVRPLPYQDPDRILSVGLAPEDKTSARALGGQVPHWAYLAWQAESRSFAELAAYRPAGPFDAPRPASGGSTWRTFFVRVLGRLAVGVGMTQAQTELTGLLAHAKFSPPFMRDAAVEVMTLHERLYGSTRPLLLILLGAVGFLLLIACANVASLLVARAAVRQREFAVRAALGAGRRRLMRQLLAESVGLAILGAGAGLVVPALGLRLFMQAAPLRALQGVDV